MQVILALFIALCIYTAQRRIYAKYWDEGLEVSISFRDTYMGLGDENELYEIVSNQKKLPLIMLHVKFAVDRSFEFEDNKEVLITDNYYRDDVYSVMGNQRIKRTMKFVAKKRGLYVVSGFNFVARDFFMTQMFAKAVLQNQEIYVFPGKLSDDVVNGIFSHIYGEYVSKVGLVENPYSFRGIREYDSSCSMRRINWKASARTEELLVNMYDKSTDYKIKLLVNLETNTMLKHELMTEKTIELASTIAEKLLDRDIPVSVVTNGVDVVSGICEVVPVGNTRGHMLEIDKCLARIDKSAGVDCFRDILNQEKNSTELNITYVVVSSYCKSDMLGILDEMVNNGNNLYMISPHFSIEEDLPKRAYIEEYIMEY